MRPLRAPLAALLALAVALPAPALAQRRDKAEAWAFVLYLQGVAARNLARSCERGDPAYRAQFEAHYARWAERHREGLAMGEKLFRAAADGSGTQYLNAERMAQARAAVAELDGPPADTGPLELTPRMREACKANIWDLAAQAK